MGRRLSLDHLTVTDAGPVELVELAARSGCSGVCPFLHSMAVLPAMPEYDLVRDISLRRAMRDALRASGLRVDLMYPLTLAGRSEVRDFAPLLEAGADLGASMANVLCYDRDPQRRHHKLAGLAELANSFGIGLSIEFYLPSQVGTLTQALAEIEAVGRSDIGVTADVLHLMRGGEARESLELLSDPRVRIAQLSDGPVTIARERIEWEAGIQRLLPGQGALDLRAFLSALAPGLAVSVEAPQQSAIEAGVSKLERVCRAVSASLALLENENSMTELGGADGRKAGR
ncbi:sugar phosphate isomerase/epimerase [Novosphingobium sp. P6W]|uniref:sugar phosphate isomerase/epimerase family protein n=1 Tax=Novosphingobium sp. P6W TaxID=1609758 RepID=UPI000695F282|nr:sugar phosphate isomerase/epimerase [Novosphingobium sp. P6W]AXB80293.1 sugar phosphate isomerase/epimerase [Novosphingobium sp. P6W]